MHVKEMGICLDLFSIYNFIYNPLNDISFRYVVAKRNLIISVLAHFLGLRPARSSSAFKSPCYHLRLKRRTDGRIASVTLLSI